MQTKVKTNNKVLSIVGKCIYWFFAAVFGIYFLLPFFVLLTRAAMTIDEVATMPVPILPKGINWENFIYAFKNTRADIDFLRALWNSFYIMMLKTAGVTLSSSIVAFALARIPFRGNNILFSIGMGTIMMPGIVITIPLFTVYYKLGMLNTHYPLWLPACFGGGMTVIFLEMQFIKSIPKTVDEAASIDGANYFVIYTNIVLPLIKPVLVYVAVTTSIGAWTDFMGPLTYISSAYPNMFTFPLAFFINFPSSANIYDALPNVKSALSLIMMLPPFILFAFFHKEMINGISLSAGIKG